MINGQFEHISALQYRVKSLSAQVEAFKSGAKYQEMDSNCRALIKKMEQNRIKYQNELARAHAETIDVRNKWFQTCDDLDKEHAAEIKEKDREIAMLKARLLEVERQRDAALDKVTEQRHELYEVKTCLLYTSDAADE